MTKPEPDPVLEQRIVRIESTFLGFEEDHGIFTAIIRLNDGSGGQAAPAYRLMSIAGPYIAGVLGACGVSSWEKLPGRTIFALVEPGNHGQIRGLAPLPMDRGKLFMFDDILKGEA